MPITAKQKELRKNHIGGSDLAAICGMDEYKNAYDVYLEKTGKLEEDERENEAMKAGTYLEDGVLKFAEERLGKLVRNQYRSAKDKGIPIGTNIDAIVVEPLNGEENKGDPVEAKTSQLYYYHGSSSQWGKEDTDEVPSRTIIQCHAQMICTDTEICHVPALVGGKGLVMYHVPLDIELKKMLEEKAVYFWNEHVLKDIPPDDVIPSLDVVKRVRREPGTVVSVPDDIVRNWLNAKELANQADKQKKEAEAILKAALGTAEGATCESGMVTYLQQHCKGYKTKPSTYRVLRFKKGEQNDKETK